jgi:hypothetical protein
MHAHTSDHNKYVKENGSNTDVEAWEMFNPIWIGLYFKDQGATRGGVNDMDVVININKLAPGRYNTRLAPLR